MNVSHWITLGIVVLLPLTEALAEVVTDGSIGAPGQLTLTGSTYNITEALGQQQGSNLFHSFSRFNVLTGEQATFQTHQGIENVIARVTGVSASTVDGTVAIVGSLANLWLINPNGWLVGPHALFDTQGSLHLSTASSIGLQDGSRFSADLSKASTLSVTAPLNVELDRLSQGKITFDQTNVKLPAYQTISLTSGTVELKDAQLQVPGGHIYLGGISSGRVQIDAEGLHQTNANSVLGDVSVSNKLDIAHQSNAQKETLSVSQFSASLNKPSSLNKPLIDGGKIDILGGQVSLTNVSLTSVDTSGKKGGEIVLEGQKFDLKGAVISASSLSNGPAGDIQVKANQLNLTDKSSIKTDSSTAKATNSTPGQINLELQEGLQLTNQSAILSSNRSSGNGGLINIHAPLLDLSHDAAIRTVTTANGNGGTINVNADKINLQSGGTIDSSSFKGALGIGGDINISSQQVAVNDMGSLITASTFGSGHAGTIDLQTRDLDVRNHGEIRTLSQGIGDAGSINLSTHGQFWLENAAISTSASLLQAKGGPIQINADTLFLRHGQITTSVGQAVDLESNQNTQTSGNGGNIDVTANNLVMDGGFMQANTFANKAFGGDINVNPQHFIISGGENNLLVNGKHIAYDVNKRVNVIQAVAPLGVNGNVNVNNIELNIAGQLAPVDSSFVPKRPIDDNPCRVIRGQSLSSLVALGQGSLPHAVSEPTDSSLSRHLKTDKTSTNPNSNATEHDDTTDLICSEQPL